MTELEKRAKSLNNARMKYPEVTDENQLRELADKLDKRNNFLKSMAMIFGGAFSVLVSMFLNMETLTGLLMIAGSVCVFNGVSILISVFKKEKSASAYTGEIKLVDTEYLKSLYKKDDRKLICLQAIAVAIMATFILVYSNDKKDVLWVFAIALPVLALFWFFHIRSINKKKRAIDQGGFKLLRTRVYDKEDVESVGTEAETVHHFYLIFKYEGKWSYSLYKEVKRSEFNKRRIGEECCLMLLLNEKLKRYEIANILWNGETTIAPDLEKYFATDDEIAEKNKDGAYGITIKRGAVNFCTRCGKAVNGERTVEQQDTSLCAECLEQLRVYNKLREEVDKLVDGYISYYRVNIQPDFAGEIKRKIRGFLIGCCTSTQKEFVFYRREYQKGVTLHSKVLTKIDSVWYIVQFDYNQFPQEKRFPHPEITDENIVTYLTKFMVEQGRLFP